MAIRRPEPEGVVVKLRQVEVLMGQGMPRIDAIGQIGVTDPTHSVGRTRQLRCCHIDHFRLLDPRFESSRC